MKYISTRGDAPILGFEDVVTSGGQIIISTNDLRNEGAFISKAICVIDRQSGGTESLNENRIELISLFTMEKLKDSIHQTDWFQLSNLLQKQ